MCRHCTRIFVESRPGAVFCSPQYKNMHNVYRSRGKNKDDDGNVVGLPDVRKILENVHDRVIRSVTRKVTDRVTEKVTDNLDKKSMQILALISEDPAYTSTAIAEKLSISRKTVSQRLKEMKEKDIIERIGSDRKGYWKINND